ncbi:MAG TPA: hypothetical protein VJ484_12430 [Lysobacter sp.]|nr:hypothetical protein [Lysobacter sp.]
MDASIITAVAALTGSLVGGLTTFATTWFTHRYQARRERMAKEIAKRETLYGDFINEATRVGINATEREIDSLSELTQLLALINRIRLTSSDEVLAAANAVLIQIGELYIGGNKTPREVFEEARNLGTAPDPLRAFSEACRRELQNW